MEKDQNRLKALGSSENAIKVTLWRYQNPMGSKKACKDELGITRNNAKRWWNVRLFIDGAIAGGGHVHFPLGLNYDVVKETILEAIQKRKKINNRDTNDGSLVFFTTCSCFYRRRSA